MTTAGLAGLGILLTVNAAPAPAPFVPSGTAVPDGGPISSDRPAPGGAAWNSPVPGPAVPASAGDAADAAPQKDTGGPGRTREPLAPALAPGPLPRTAAPALPHARAVPEPRGTVARDRSTAPSRPPASSTGGDGPSQARRAPAPRPRPAPVATASGDPAARPSTPASRQPPHLPNPCATFDELRRTYCHAVLDELFNR
ncbi:hypothetical protein HS041_13905 [Planomonospora sp. ID67723]|uniref:hypothetical protein n=1 Tax=Planomonospora sp. ID67723 TaxID=2738134 RepID=UPI0018C39512|nr:hypothetical protein [Planomonospora sp. ID67723]MBG0828864.1 hypothetical protein [Planomonospora sp. ID67723]